MSQDWSTSRPAHHTARGYVNPPGSPVRRVRRTSFFRFIWRRVLVARQKPAVPNGHVLSKAEAVAGLVMPNGNPGLTWLGHAAFLVRLGGKTILTDPYLGDFASPVPPFGPKLFVPPPVAVEDLPPIDLLLVSHNHYDHLCADTIDRLPGKDRVQVVVPLGLGSFFTSRGYARVAELDWYDRFDQDGVGVTALPAVHWSKRRMFDRNKTLWASFAIAGEGLNIWFGGDTGLGPVFAELGQSYGPFDLALVGIGAYEPREIMKASHATPEEAVQICRDLRARRVMGMHWGTVVLTDEPAFEPPDRFRAAAQAAGYGPDETWLMRVGETRHLPGAWPANA